jgi:hypothetical protein
MNLQEYQDTLKEQASLFYQTEQHPAYLGGWLASQCVQMYELLTTAQQQEFADKLQHAMSCMQDDIDGKPMPDNKLQTH